MFIRRSRKQDISRVTRHEDRDITLKSFVLTTVTLILLLHILSVMVAKPILPSPFVVLDTLIADISGDLGQHILASLYRIAASILLSIILATPAGLILGQSRTLNRKFASLIYLVYPIPKVVLVPVVLLFLGVGDLSKIAIITMILFFQILVLVRDAASSIRTELILSVRSLGAGRRALFRFVYLPASVPAILTAVRQSIGTAIAVLYIAELFATRYGLGYYIYYQGNTLFDYPRMYAGVVAMSLLGLALYHGVDMLQHWLCRWCLV